MFYFDCSKKTASLKSLFRVQRSSLRVAVTAPWGQPARRTVAAFAELARHGPKTGSMVYEAMKTIAWAFLGKLANTWSL